MNVKQLKALLEKVPDHAVVLVPAFNHSYHVAWAEVGTAMEKDEEWTEDHGDEYTPEGEDYGTRRAVLVFRS